MKLEHFIEKFAMQFEDTDAEVFTASTEFRNLDEWDSMLVLSIIAMVDEEYEVRIKGTDIQEVSTVEELFYLIENLKK